MTALAPDLKEELAERDPLALPKAPQTKSWVNLASAL